MAPEGLVSFSVASVVEDVLQQHGARPRQIDMASRLSEEAACRRNEAATWLKKTLAGLGHKDLPEKPTEEEFLLALRSGIILCNALNSVDPGVVPKVVELPANPSLLPDGAALSAYQYFENIRNFLVVVQDKGLPTFEACDLEQGGKCARVVNCILALKSYSEWKKTGGIGPWKYGGNLKSAGSGNYYIRKNSELFVNSFSKNLCSNGKVNEEQNFSSGFNDEPIEMTASHSLNMLVKAVLSEKKPEEIPSVVESMLKKVVEEFERRMIVQNEMENAMAKEFHGDGGRLISKRRVLAELTISSDTTKTEIGGNCVHGLKSSNKRGLAKQNSIFERQQKDIQDLKNVLRSTRAGIQIMQTNYVQEMATLGKHLSVLANAAARYQTVLGENRRLYNEVQDLKGNIRVYCRVRPFLPGERSAAGAISHTDEGNIAISNTLKSGKEERKSFAFNRVFGPSASQEEVYLDTQPLIRSVLDGFNVCIFAYGQTGSGKTYTMMGPKEVNEESRGVNYRALSDLFQLSEKRKDTTAYQISVQMIEIYNEQVRDLLVNDGLVKKLEIRSGSQKGGLIVPNANLVPVSSTPEVIELMSLGQRNRAVSATAMNDRSSRSHSCLTVHVQGKEVTSGAVLRGCMHLVDLAGSERVQKSDVSGERMKEAQHINRSLSALGDVIAALAQKNGHIPYRNSKLTQLLQDSLGGQAKTLMFVHVSPDEDTVGETISTLKFAERVSSVELGAARVNKETQEVKDLKEQVARLKAALARKESEPEESTPAIKSTPLSHRPAQSTPLTKPTSRRERNNNSVSRQRGPGFDLQEQLMAAADPPHWPDDNPSVVNGADEENETDSGEWVDKVVVNKLTSFGSGSSLGEEPSTPLTFKRNNSSESFDSDSSESDPVLASASKTRKSQQRRAPSQPPCQPPPLRKIPSGPIRALGRPKQAP